MFLSYPVSMATAPVFDGFEEREFQRKFRQFQTLWSGSPKSSSEWIEFLLMNCLVPGSHVENTLKLWVAKTPSPTLKQLFTYISDIYQGNNRPVTTNDLRLHAQSYSGLHPSHLAWEGIVQFFEQENKKMLAPLPDTELLNYIKAPMSQIMRDACNSIIPRKRMEDDYTQKVDIKLGLSTLAEWETAIVTYVLTARLSVPTSAIIGSFE